MGLFDRYNIKQDSVTLGLTLFYLTALIMTVIFNKDNYINTIKINKKVIINDNNINEEKDITNIDNNNNDIINSIDNSSIDIKSISKNTTPNTSPIKMVASSSNTIYPTEFVTKLKKGINIIRIKSNKQKKKIIIMNDNYKLSIRAINNNFLSSMKKTKEFPLQLIDSVIINDLDNKCFSLFLKEGRMVSKYEILTESKNQCEDIVNGLLVLKEYEQKETGSLLGALSLKDENEI